MGGTIKVVLVSGSEVKGKTQPLDRNAARHSQRGATRYGCRWAHLTQAQGDYGSKRANVIDNSL